MVINVDGRRGMNSGYIYCLDNHTCIHRRGCKRWFGNYNDDDKAYIITFQNRYIDENKCINSKPYPYKGLDRLRLSDGSEFDK